MYTKAFLAVVFSITSYCCYSQGKTSSIKGIITDAASGETLEQASVSLVRITDSVVTRQVLSGKNGFEFRRVVNGNYWLMVSFIGYRSDTLMFSLANTDSIYNTGRIRLMKSSVNLMEVVVVEALIPPVIVKNDTLVYNANVFKTQPNATVEDLLKKLPGLEVDKNGNVTVQGKKVAKIYIDGKEFFLGDPKIAIQNLTADMVKAIEVFNNQSDRARFTGIRETNANKAINLRLKKDRKKGLFGNVMASAGTQNTYSGAATATYLRQDRWAFVNFNASYSDNLALGAGQMQSVSNQALNYRNNVADKALLIVNYTGGINRNKSGQSYRRETFLVDSSLLQNSDMFNNNRSANYEINSSFTYNIDSFSSVIYTPSLSFRQREMMNFDSSSIITQKVNSNYVSSAGGTMNKVSSDGSALTNSITFHRRFKKKGRSLYMLVRQSYQQQNQDGKLYSSVKFDDNGSAGIHKVVDQEYDQINHGNNWGVDISCTEPIRSNQIIDLSYSLNTSSNSSGKGAFNYNSATDKYDIPDTLTTNYFVSGNTQQNFNIGYNYIGKAVQYQLGLSMLYSSLKNESRSRSYNTIEQLFLNWSPRASAFFMLTNQKSLQLQYSGQSIAPTTQMLQPIPDLSNPFLINLGNPNLKQQFQHSFNFNYNSSNNKNFSNLSLQAGGDYTTNKIVQSSTITQGGIQEMQYVNVSGVYTVNSYLNYGFSINKIKNGSGQLSTSLQYSRDLNLVNGEQNVWRAFMFEQGFNLNYHTKDELYAGISVGIQYNHSYYSIGENLNTELLSQHYSANITYTLPFSIRASSDFSVQKIGKQGSLPGMTIVTWNASVYRNIFRNNKGEIRFSAFDLLNRNIAIRQSAGNNYIETRKSNTLRRYFVLSLRYNFRLT